jgi:YHYH protein/Secretion system C-terminal sorting domain
MIIQPNLKMKKSIATLSLIVSAAVCFAQGPIITTWLQNNTVMGQHYVQNNPTPIQDNVLANVQTVQYSTNWVYVSTNGIPAYITGPFLDGNPSLASDQNAIFRFPLIPQPNTGNPTSTTPGNIGIFINGVALFDYRDGVSWRLASGTEQGGPIQGPPGDGVWNRDAVVAERLGFDCAKGHPAMGNYHHHQNPSAFDLDLNVLSTICSTYDADGLYVIDSTVHSPLLGFAADGYPIYGAYGYQNTNGTGPIVRIKSSYQLRNITVRTHYADGSDVTDGPPVSTAYPLGRYREDYEFIAHPNDPDYLDEHNGRFCITPEFPNGTYAYFCTVDAGWNSAYPYAVGPTFYGIVSASKVTSINEPTTIYTAPTGISQNDFEQLNIALYPNPSDEFIVLQAGNIVTTNLQVRIYDNTGRLVQQSQISQGSTLAWIDTRTLYNGSYYAEVVSGESKRVLQFIVAH